MLRYIGPHVVTAFGQSSEDKNERSLPKPPIKSKYDFFQILGSCWKRIDVEEIEEVSMKKNCHKRR